MGKINMDVNKHFVFIVFSLEDFIILLQVGYMAWL